MGRRRVRNRVRKPKPVDLIHQEGPQPEGPQPEGPRHEGPRPEGPQPEGLQQEGFQHEGLHQEGPHQEGPRQKGLHQEVPQPDGLHQEDLIQEGLQQEVPQPEGLQPEGLQQEGPQPEGLQPEGLHQEELIQEGLRQDGLQPEGLQPEGLQPEGLPQELLHQEGPRQEGLHQEGPDQEGPRQEGLHQDGPYQEGQRQEGPHQEGPHQEGPRQEGPRQEGEDTNTEPGEKALGTLKARLTPRPGGTSKTSMKKMVIILYLRSPFISRLGNLLIKDNDVLEMPTDGNHHVAVRQQPINALISCIPILNQDQPAATPLPDVVQIKEKPFVGLEQQGTSEVVMGCTEPVATQNNTEIPDMTDDEGEEPLQDSKEKSLGWRFLNWLSVVEKYPNHKRITRTYLKEATEEHLISSKAFKHQAALLSTKLSMGEKEQIRMRIYRAERREQKEALRLKEEQRYEQWAAEVGLSDAGEGPEDGPKKRMTRLDKVALGCISRLVSLFQ
ncbi:uncharacterized protein LOC115560397 [Gadus morhua]|uniref:uncharacterized protein LOC115560397 n=1 Tax=Gadus morhua TaxID=8049 RepID=UPI0011B5E780|nr:uncharacterized protein LOC115560397 [Gadus morhua]